MKLTKPQREQLRMKFGGKCAYCGPDQALTNLTHWKPLDELASGGQGRVRE